MQYEFERLGKVNESTGFYMKYDMAVDKNVHKIYRETYSSDGLGGVNRFSCLLLIKMCHFLILKSHF
jgi:hypothetical protein